MKKRGRQICMLAVGIFMLFLCICIRTNVVEAADVTVPDDKIMTTLKEYTVAPGIKEYHLTMVKSDGSDQVRAFIMMLDSNNKNVGVMAGYKNYDTSGKWGMQTVRDQAAAAEKKTGRKVVGAMNADYFNMSTGEPFGALVMGGKVVSEAQKSYSNAAYFAVLKDGSMVLRDSSVPMTDVQEAVGSPFWLIRDGQIETWFETDSTAMPRAAIGIKDDGTVVLFEADGRQAPKSCGLSVWDTAKEMKALGCVNAVYLDGGGSATFCTRSEGETALTVKNSPSDGVERSVSSSLLIYSTAKASGEFDHAVISPSSDVYTPGSTITFSAVGVDSAGEKVNLPSDFSLKLEDTSMGEMTSGGVFTSNGKTGEVVVQAVSDGTIVGTTSIEIQKPDAISFVNDEVSLGFETETDLGLHVTYKNQEIQYSDTDFEWEIKDVTDANGVSSDKTLGTFQGNIFTSSDGSTLFGTVVCSYKGSDVRAQVRVIVGLQPTVVMDFEDQVAEDGSVTKATDYWTFNRAVFEAGGGTILKIWDREGNVLSSPTANLLYGHYCNDVYNPDNSRGGNESAEIVDIASGYPVLKGNYALKLNYDFSNINGIEGACVGFANASQEIPGNPTAIGMYVYVPENTPNLWLRIRIKDGTGTVLTLDFTEKMTAAEPGKLGGLDWTGWKYVEASLEGKTGPFTLLGGETIRLMHTYSAYGGMGNYLPDGTELPRSQCKGSIFVDNVQFVYGANTDDTDNPEIKSVKVDNAEISEDTVLTSNYVTFEAQAADVQNKYTSGIDYATANVYLDGVNVTNKETENGNFVTDSSKDALFLYNQYLTNGSHSIRFTIRDNFGNETSETRTFTVKGTSQNTPDIGLKPLENVYLGGIADLQLRTDEVENVKSVETTIQLGKGFSDYTVSYGDDYEEVEEPVFDESSNIVKISARRKSDAEGDGEGIIAHLSVKIPEDTDKSVQFSYAVNKGLAVVSSDKTEEIETTFSSKTVRKTIQAKYQVSVDTILVGTDANLYVADENGQVVSGISVYLCGESGDELLGTTDEYGRLVTDRFTDVRTIALYAKDSDGMRSFILNTQSYSAGGSEDGKPEFISLNVTDGSATSKNISWISTPNVSNFKSIVKIAETSEYNAAGESAFREYEGTSKWLEFKGSAIIEENKTVYANAVNVTGLKQATSYVYRVGDGVNWSDLQKFTTSYKGKNTKFFVIGDTQADDVSTISNIAEMISDAEDPYSFGIQTGDFVEKASLYEDWKKIMGAFQTDVFKGIDMCHVTGNHELFGDDDASVSTSLFNIKSRKRYSFTYGNVYVAVMGYVDTEKDAIENSKWLVSDASKSDAKWKILVSHQPPYGTNATTSDCKFFTQYIPNACSQAGIDVMFSGHDHSYARTYPLMNGKVDEKNGTVYYICGSTGEKTYAVTKQDDVHAIATNEGYEGIYITVEATSDTMEIVARNENGDIFDSYTLDKSKCPNGMHEYLINKDGYLVCEKCGGVIPSTGYTGLVRDVQTKEYRSISNGELDKEKWVASGEDFYYMDEEGYAVTGTVNIKGIDYTFDNKGKFIRGSFVKETVTNAQGKSKTITRYYTGGGVFAVHWVEIDGNMYYFKKTGNNESVFDLGMMYTGDGKKPTLVKTVANNSNRYYTFAKNGKLVVGAFDTVTDENGVEHIRYFWGDEYLKGTVNAGGFTYQFDENTGYMLTKDISNLSFSNVNNTYDYTGKEIIPDVIIKDGDQTLVRDTNYTVSYTNNVEVGTAQIVITGKADRGYTGKKTIYFNIKKQGTPVVTSKVSVSKLDYTYGKSYSYTGKAIVPKVTVKQKGITLVLNKDYKLTYNNNKAIGTASITVKGVGKYTGTKKLTFNIVLGTTKINSAKNVSSKKVKISWKKVTGATGYIIYTKTTKNSTYKRVANIKKATTVKYTLSNLKKGKTYYIKVKAYKKVNGETIYGNASSYKSVKIIK